MKEGLFESFLDEVKKTLITTIQEVVQFEISNQNTDRWMNKQQLAEYWGVSISWIDKNLDYIPPLNRRSCEISA